MLPVLLKSVPFLSRSIPNGVKVVSFAAKQLNLVGQLVSVVGATVLRLLSCLRAVGDHALLSPLRFVLIPFRWVFGKLLTGDWVPTGPWMVIWIILGMGSSIQEYKRLLKLTVQLFMHKRGAGCKLCDTVIALVLKFDENSPEDIDCVELCPFGIKACLTVCEKLVLALKESSHYPCVSVGMCPDLSEPPECELVMPFFSCQPAEMCRLVPGWPRPRCELLPGLAHWTRWKSMVGQNIGAFASAITSRPRCGDPGAHPTFCLQGSSGLGYACELLTMLLIVLAFALSIHAIESENRDDDQQWLTFWICLFLLALLERLTDVLLSRYDDAYFALKLALVVWLIFLRGAELTEVIDPNETVVSVQRLLASRNFAILSHKTRTLTTAEAEVFYAEHDGTRGFPALVSALCAGPLVAFAVELPNAARVLGELVKEGVLVNAHVSSPEEVARELKLFFPEVFPRETTFALLKPDVEKAGVRADLIHALEAKGFVVSAELVETLTLERAQALMPSATAQQLSFLTSQPSCMLALEKPFAIGELAALCGPSDPLVAREVQPASLRAHFGTDALKNAIDVSTSVDEAARQLAVAFGPQAFVDGRDEHTLALVLPEATAAGKVPAAIEALRAAGFKVIASKEVPLTASAAKQLLPGVDAALVEYAQSGASTAICVSRPHAVRTMLSLSGPPGKAVTSTLSTALGFETVPQNRSPVVCPSTAASAAVAMGLLFPELRATQTTLAIIKPDAVAAGATEAVLERLHRAGFTVRARTSLTLPAFKAEEFYAEHAGKSFLPSLVQFMGSGPCVALALTREGAIAEWRALMGPTATAKAREQAPGSLRALFGTDNTRNATHGSDSELSARRELKFFFPSLSVEPLPQPDEVAVSVREQLEPSLVHALTELCKAKPDDPVRWLGAFLLAHNPNKPKVAQLVVQLAQPRPPARKITPDAKVIEGLRAHFERLDADQSGSLSLHEFRAAEVGRLGITLPDIDLVKAQVFATLDADGDSRVSWAEFKAGLLERSADLCFDSRVSLYRQLFGQGAYAGARTAAELVSSLEANQAVLQSLFGDGLPGLLEVFAALDKDGSGAVTWDEFVEQIEGAFRPRAPIAHRERIKKRAPPPFVAPPSAPPPPAVM